MKAPRRKFEIPNMKALKRKFMFPNIKFGHLLFGLSLFLRNFCTYIKSAKHNPELIKGNQEHFTYNC